MGLAAISQRTLGTPRIWTCKEGFSPRPSEGAQPSQHLDFRFLAFLGALRESIAAAESLPAFGHLLRQPEEAHTPTTTPPDMKKEVQPGPIYPKSCN